MFHSSEVYPSKCISYPGVQSTRSQNLRHIFTTCYTINLIIMLTGTEDIHSQRLNDTTSRGLQFFDRVRYMHFAISTLPQALALKLGHRTRSKCSSTGASRPTNPAGHPRRSLRAQYTAVVAVSWKQRIMRVKFCVCLTVVRTMTPCSPDNENRQREQQVRIPTVLPHCRSGAHNRWCPNTCVFSILGKCRLRAWYEVLTSHPKAL